MTNQLSQKEWVDIFKNFKNTPEQLTAIEILRQHIIEDCNNLLVDDSCWYRHYKKSDKPYFP